MPLVRDPVAQALEVRAKQLRREVATGGNPGRSRAVLELLAEEFERVAYLIDGTDPLGRPVIFAAMLELEHG